MAFPVGPGWHKESIWRKRIEIRHRQRVGHVRSEGQPVAQAFPNRFLTPLILGHPSQFLRQGFAAGGPSPGVLQERLRGRTGPGFGADAMSQFNGLLLHEGVIQQHQSLRGHRGDGALREWGGSVAVIKGLEHRHHGSSPDVGIDAASGPFTRFGHLPVGARSGASRQYLAAERREKTPPASLQIQGSRDRQQTVAQRLGIQTTEILTPQQVIGWIRFEGLWILHRRRLHPGGRGEDEPVEGFDGPALADKLAGQPIQQFRVCGKASHAPEIGGGSDQPSTEMVMPNPVHQHPGGQWVGGAGDPLRQGLPTTRRGQTLFPDRRIAPSGCPQESRSHFSPRRPWVTSGQHLHCRRRAPALTGRQCPFEGRPGLLDCIHASGEVFANHLVGCRRALRLQLLPLAFLRGFPGRNFSR